jgi:hypothetical protein
MAPTETNMPTDASISQTVQVISMEDVTMRLGALHSMKSWSREDSELWIAVLAMSISVLSRGCKLGVPKQALILLRNGVLQTWTVSRCSPLAIAHIVPNPLSWRANSIYAVWWLGRLVFMMSE